MSDKFRNFAIANKMIVSYPEWATVIAQRVWAFLCPYYIRIRRCHCVRLSLSGSIILLAAQVTPLFVSVIHQK